MGWGSGASKSKTRRRLSVWWRSCRNPRMSSEFWAGNQLDNDIERESINDRNEVEESERCRAEFKERSLQRLKI